jgi:hypothetical protein
MPPAEHRRGLGLALLVVGGAAVGGWALAASQGGPLSLSAERCVATVAGHSASLDLDQAQHASTIAAVAVRRGLPARAVSIALATAYQESDIRNLDYGDRDSLGLFQQRPSQGWGTPSQVQDPVYAANRFYDALVLVDGYQQLAITDAAQEVQRSAFGGAYADHEADARALASALTGYSPAAFSCVVDDDEPSASLQRVRTALAKAFGDVATTRREKAALSVAVGSRIRGWAVASHLVANADRLGVTSVAYAGRRWATGAASEDGWVPTRSRPGNGDVQADAVRVGVG